MIWPNFVKDIDCLSIYLFILKSGNSVGISANPPWPKERVHEKNGCSWDTGRSLLSSPVTFLWS